MFPVQISDDSFFQRVGLDFRTDADAESPPLQGERRREKDGVLLVRIAKSGGVTPGVEIVRITKGRREGHAEAEIEIEVPRGVRLSVGNGYRSLRTARDPLGDGDIGTGQSDNSAAGTDGALMKVHGVFASLDPGSIVAYWPVSTSLHTEQTSAQAERDAEARGGVYARGCAQASQPKQWPAPPLHVVVRASRAMRTSVAMTVSNTPAALTANTSSIGPTWPSTVAMSVRNTKVSRLNKG